MKAEHDLLQAYREWHRLALAEAKAIQLRDWNLLNDCQLAIKDFQTAVTHLAAEARKEWLAAGCDLAEKEKHVHVFIHQLIETTRQNQTLLEATKLVVRERLGQLEEAGRNLKRLRHSYGTMTSRWSTAA